MKSSLALIVFLILTATIAAHDSHSHSHSHSHDHSHEHDLEEIEDADILPHDAPVSEVDLSGHYGDGCLHHQLVKAMKTTHKPRRAPQKYEFNLHGNETMAEQHAARRKLMSVNGAKYIRIKFDLTNINGNDPLACQSVGQVVDGLTCKQADIMTAANKKYLTETLLPAAKAWIQSAFMVVPVSGALTITGSGGKCYKADFSSSPHYNTDIVFVVTGRPTGGAALAWATSCQFDQFSRPVAGQINFGPANLDDSLSVRRQQVGVAIHEMSHVLGFSAYMWDKFIDANNNIRPLTQVRQTSTLWDPDHIIHKIGTRKVVAEARSFFKCSTADGVQLEDGGGGGSAGSHWDKRIMFEDFMNPTALKEPEFSRITFALFEDSGHYKMDYSASTPWSWGRNKGCAVLNDKCNTWDESWRMTAKTPGAEFCTFDRKKKGVLATSKYTQEIPKWFRYFPGDNYLGGMDQYADFCPIIKGYGNGACADRDNAPAGSFDSLGESYGKGSACFETTLFSTKYSGSVSTAKPRCHPFQCTNNKVLKIRVGYAWIECPANGGAVSVPSFKGTLNCPSYEEMCIEAPSGPGTDGTDDPNTPPPVDNTPKYKYFKAMQTTNVRDGPGTSHKLLFAAKKDDVFALITKNGLWYQMKKMGGNNAGELVWIYGLELVQTNLYCPALNGLSMRSGDGESYTRIWSAQKNEVFLIKEARIGWKRVVAVSAPRAGTFAWAKSTYIVPCNPEPPKAGSSNGGGSTSGGTGTTGSTTANQQYWLKNAGGYTVDTLDKSSVTSFITQKSMNKFLLETVDGKWPRNGDYEQALKMMDATKRYSHFIVAKDNSGSLKIVQLLPFNKAANYLDAGNWAGCIQVMVGASASKPFTTYDSQLTAAVKALYKAVSDATGIPISVDSRVSFKESGAYGYNAPQRLSRPTFYAVTGLVGQQHAYSNRGWSPGAINPSKLM